MHNGLLFCLITKKNSKVYALILTWLYGAVLAKSDYFHGQTNLA